MIKLRDNVVSTLLDDGSTAIMDFESLRKRLKRSWKAAGYPDDSIAEDIAFSVELALSESACGSDFTSSEIDAFVLKVLREAGLVEVAEHYGLNFTSVDSLVPVELNSIIDIVRRFTPLEGSSVESIAEKVLESAVGFGANEASPTLLLELARHFASAPKPPESSASRTTSKHMSDSVWLVRSDEILEMAAPASRELIDGGFLNQHGVSALFPSIRLDFDIAKFADSLDLSPPAPELALLPRFVAFADAVNDIVDKLDARLSETGRVDINDIALRLTLLHSDSFAEIWLGGVWPESRHAVVELMEIISESFVRDAYLRILPEIPATRKK